MTIGGPPLVVAAHGTINPDGRAVIENTAARAAGILGVPHTVGYVDVCPPTLHEALAAVATAPVVVPVFLASGYHIQHDVPRAVADEQPSARVTPALGAAPEVIDALVERLALLPEVPDAVVLVATGSTRAEARTEVRDVADRLADQLTVPVEVGFLVGDHRPVPDAVTALRNRGATRIAVAAHLLGPGVFLERLVALSATLKVMVTGPVGPSPRITDLVVRRYRDVMRAGS